MDVNAPTPLLGGLSPAQFMRRHWQKRPLLVRQAWPGLVPPATRAQLFALAGQPDVESRLVRRDGAQWQVGHGPFRRRALPPVAQPGWTLLVQGLDLHLDAARALLAPFRFLPEARLDDLMVSWASDGGGVGPHVDAYDVFLLQAAGRRRWRVGRAADRRFIEGLPLKILRRFEPQFDWVLEPGDLLYLPPLWGHDGSAVGGDCVTCSVGFRTPDEQGLAGDLLQRLADDDDEGGGGANDDDRRIYRDPAQPATDHPAALPPALLAFARRAVRRRLADADRLACALGEAMSEPKPRVWFQAREGQGPAQAQQALAAAGVRLDRRSRMLYDERRIFINGEAFDAGGRDATLLRRLADRRCLDAAACARLSTGARAVLQTWLDDGWLQPLEDDA
ncbi:MAG: cupin domain-containing protein [Proteobacteria bacterium]|nr:cupin domain-containing protein [Pseudomonadota bacterium]